MSVFELDGTCFKFRHPKKVEEAYNEGKIEKAAYEKYLEGRKSYCTKHGFDFTLDENDKKNEWVVLILILNFRLLIFLELLKSKTMAW